MPEGTNGEAAAQTIDTALLDFCESGALTVKTIFSDRLSEPLQAQTGAADKHNHEPVCILGCEETKMPIKLPGKLEAVTCHPPRDFMPPKKSKTDIQHTKEDKKRKRRCPGDEVSEVNRVAVTCESADIKGFEKVTTSVSETRIDFKMKGQVFRDDARKEAYHGTLKRVVPLREHSELALMVMGKKGESDALMFVTNEFFEISTQYRVELPGETYPRLDDIVSVLPT
ncbi:hypothetical protein CYMTET_15360 [Cymbomonas tetramitiformis]|uniref:Uncharacterized protein n=1 Tax=Cymbomonas tetramitiformis TaxID=36881 RepID=A0AAE0L9F1_9CHLO|nr:hypothetical protein CYMTET_15360 [Cymbomonas tetramitiformis]